ncbi:hypothetical protein G7054_g14076 [Neopestalotiopsis clavispora]|nr:hypothetical protein G7054_g14076 [Neopestalotiopsis clavispora]
MSTGNQTMVESDEPKAEASTSKNEDIRATVSPTEPHSLKPEDDDNHISGFKLAAVVGSITMVVFILLLDVSIIATWVFVLFLFLFEVGSFICGVSTSSIMFIIGRVVAGLGGSGLINGALTMVSGAVPVERRAFHTSLMMGIGQLGLISGPLLGGAFTQYTTWRWCFYINLPAGAIAACILVALDIPDLTKKEPFSFALIRKVIPQLDLLGFALLAPTSIMFLLALQLGGNEYEWGSATIVGLFFGSGVLAIIFVIRESRVGDKAMIPSKIIKQKIAISSAIQGMFLFGTVTVASYYFPIYFQAVKGAGPALSGVYLLPSIFSQLALVVSSGWLVTKLGYYLPWPIASGALSAIGNGLVSTFTPTTTTGQWVGYQIILGIGRGAGMQMAMIAIQTGLPGYHIPVAIAFQVFCQNMLGSILLVVASTIFNQSLAVELPKHAPSVSIEAATAAGSDSEAVRALLPDGSPELEGLLLSYSNSIDHVFILLAVCSIASFVAAFFMGWTDTRKKKGPSKGAA